MRCSGISPGHRFRLALQIFFRYVLNYPLAWPLEVSLFCFVWLVWLGGWRHARGEADPDRIRGKYLSRRI